MSKMSIILFFIKKIQKIPKSHFFHKKTENLQADLAEEEENGSLIVLLFMGISL